MMWVVPPGAPVAFSPVEITTSSSGYAFSVTSARGRFNSPRGQCGFRHNPRKYAITSSICSDVSASLNDGIMSENPRDGPPCRITSFQAVLGSGVVWSHAVKSGNVRGFSNPAISFAVPLPSEPWQAAHADLKVCSPACVFELPCFPVCPTTTASGTQNQNATNLVTARI